MQTPQDNRTDGDAALDAGLQAAFGAPADSARGSVHEVVERLTGSPAIVSLRPLESSEGPIVDASSPERRSRPLGRVSYQLLGEIARGGMGVVVRGHDPDLGRDVALKILHRELSNRPEIVRRFVEEAQIGGQLQHPGIVPVYELGLTADERPYFTMKLVKGRTLAALLAERRDKGEDRRRHLGVFEAVCQTLAYAHSRGVIHRDLKPSNVMVGAFGEVQVVDWGLAKVLPSGGVADERRAHLSHANATTLDTVRSGPRRPGTDSVAGAVLGTPAYMSPEQARGEVEQLDERSDVFGLGAILCDILTGAPPYPGRYELALTHAGRGEISEAFAKLDACGADADLVSLCKDCLRPAPADRPRNARVLAERLHAYLMSVEERARRAQVDAARTQVRLEAERKARKLTLALAASLLVGIGGYMWTMVQRETERRENEQKVNAALSDAAIEQGRSDWPAALSAIDRARAFAQSKAASDELRSRVEREGETIAREAHAAERKLELDRDNAALLAELQDIRRPEGDQIYPMDWAKLSQSYRDVFARHGLSLDDQDEAEVVAHLGSRGIDAPLASFLDEWASVRLAANEEDDSNRLRRIASRIDSDPTRQKLRAAGNNRATLLDSLAELDVDEQPAPTLLLLASALGTVDALPEEVELLRRSRRAHPSDFLLAMALARSLRRLQPPQADEALRHYEAALALRPGSVEAWHELGRTLEDLGEYAAASEHFSAAVVRYPGDGHLYFHFGAALSHTGRTVEAVAAYRRSIALEPNAALPHTNLGNELHELGQSEEALEEHRRAVEIDPQSELCRSNLGVELYETGRLEEALEELKLAVELGPDSAIAVSALGMVLQKLGRFEEAISARRRAIELDPQAADSHNSLGAVLYESAQLEQAIAAYRCAIDLNPQDAIYHLNLGVALKGTGQFEEASEELKRAVELDPDSPIAVNQLGIALAKLGHFEEAISATRRAIELDPKTAGLHINLGNQLHESGQIELAIAEYRCAIELDPTEKMAYHQQVLGTWLEAIGKHEEAIEELERAVALDPRSAQAHANLSGALLGNRQPEEAIAEAHLAIELDPSFAPAYYNLGLGLSFLGQLDAAIDAHRRAAELDPDCAHNHLSLGFVLQKQGLLDQAIDEFRRAIEIRPEDALAHFNLGVVLHRKHDLEGASAAFRSSIELDPDSARAVGRLGAVSLKLKHYEEAIAAFRRAIELDPQAATYRIDLGAALQRNGKLEEGIEVLKGAIELDPHSADAHYILGLLLRDKDQEKEAIAEHRHAVEIDPSHHGAHVALAWQLATTDLEDLRDPEGALVHARKALELAPEDSNDWENLGIALYVAGEYAEARASLEHATQLGPPDAGARALFLALCHHRLGDSDEAQRWLDRAEPGIDGLLMADPQLLRFVTEARDAVGGKEER